MVTIKSDASRKPRSLQLVTSRHPYLVTPISSPSPCHREQARRIARGYIDHSITIWIVVILALVATGSFLKQMGIEPAELWSRVPAIWKWLLAVTAALIVAGGVVLLTAGYVENHREPYRVVAQGERRLVVETKILEPTLGVVLLVAGLTFMGFGIAGAGWFSWLILALGLLLALVSAVGISSGQRYVVERGQIASERAMLGAWHAAGTCAWKAGTRPQLQIEEGGISGGWGRYEVKPDAVQVNGKRLAGNTRDARKLLPLLQQAIDDTHA